MTIEFKMIVTGTGAFGINLHVTVCFFFCGVSYKIFTLEKGERTMNYKECLMTTWLYQRVFLALIICKSEFELTAHLESPPHKRNHGQGDEAKVSSPEIGHQKLQVLPGYLEWTPRRGQWSVIGQERKRLQGFLWSPAGAGDSLLTL